MDTKLAKESFWQRCLYSLHGIKSRIFLLAEFNSFGSFHRGSVYKVEIYIFFLDDKNKCYELLKSDDDICNFHKE